MTLEDAPVFERKKCLHRLSEEWIQSIVAGQVRQITRGKPGTVDLLHVNRSILSLMRPGLLLNAPMVALLLAFISSTNAHTQQTEQAPIYTSETHLIDFTFSVRKPDGTLVKGLTQSDFQITEDGVTQKISFFGSEQDLPLSLGLIVDASDSQSKFIKRHSKDVEKFLRTVVGPRDEVFTICFGNHLRLTNDSTSSIDAVLSGMKRYDKEISGFPELDPDGCVGGTAFYDAIYYSVLEKLTQARGRRRALILFTDGEENSSAHDLLDAIGIAQDTDTLIYAIRYTDQKESKSADARKGKAALHHLAAETGGSDYDALHENVERAFIQIADELRSLYSVAYHSTHHKHDGAFHKVVITTTDSDLSVRARTGYYAK
ncbi:MAG: VWA domain-containing protein [Acidobacteriota bacterium]|nr:VWA domain-containing protein [Acidobacteriota bacterium]